MHGGVFLSGLSLDCFADHVRLGRSFGASCSDQPFTFAFLWVLFLFGISIAKTSYEKNQP